MCDNLILASYFIGGKLCLKKTALAALVVVCITAVILTALYKGSLCDVRYKDKENDLSITLAYEVR
ncbi:Hok/Gef family protein [Vibrio parahaemolyticus]|nr:Hok/Gef family protein [Vibrio parahaemolyticus]MBE4418176.1 Hok/Gef family protein [Vibrio parahaemolyticus]MBE4472043.1 Hok/Gef family protein [Vibrio parahaemolyticus]